MSEGYRICRACREAVLPAPRVPELIRVAPSVSLGLLLMLAFPLTGGWASSNPANAVDAFVFDVDNSADDPDADIGDGLCKTASNECTLRAAVMQANVVPYVNTTIHVPAGTYKLGLPSDPNRGSLKLTSPSPDSGNPVISLVGAGEAVTVIDGNLTDRVVRVDSGRQANISGLSVINGYASASGGGIFNEGTLNLVDVKIFNNKSSQAAGGGIYNAPGGAASLTLVRVTVDTNSAQNGGGIYNQGNLSISHGLIVANHSIINGGGMFTNSPTEIDFSTFSANSSGSGGGIYATSSSLLVEHSTVDGNSAFYGGGIYSSATLGLDRSTVSRNSSAYGGGVNNSGALFVTNSTLSSNHVTYNGGGVYNTGSANVYNSTVAYNEADSNLDGAGDGAGVFNAAPHTFNVRNSVIAGNFLAGEQNFNDCIGEIGFFGNNRLSELAGCTVGAAGNGTRALIGSLDELGILNDNGGPTQTIALIPPSTMIGGASICSDSASNAISFDQRDHTRPLDVSRCDLGAFEYNDVFASGFQ